VAAGFDELEVAEFRRELRVGGQFGEIERLGEARVNDRGGHVAGGRDGVVVGGAAAAEFGDEVVARAHVGGCYFAMMGFFEGVDKRGVGVALPD